MGCTRILSPILHLGPLRDFSFNYLNSRQFENCFYVDSVFQISFCLNLLSFIFQILSCVVIGRRSLWRQRKYLQFLLLNITCILNVSGFFLLILFRGFLFKVELMVCLLTCNILAFTWGWSYFGLVGLSIDCFVAVFWPLKFKSIMTTRRFFYFNFATFIFNFLVAFLPLPYFGTRNDGYLLFFCTYIFNVPPFYNYFIFSVHMTLLLIFSALNASVGVGIARALMNRGKMVNQKKNGSSVLLKSTIRLCIIITINIALTIPVAINNINTELVQDSIAISMSACSGPLNVIIFVVSDKEFRQNIRQTFSLS